MTVTVTLAVFPPSLVFTVMVAVPGPTAVTTPLASTVATLLSEEDHSTSRFVAFSGVTVAVSAAFSPGSRSSLSLSMVTPVTATVPALTVTEAVAVFPPSLVLAVMVALPAPAAVILPVWSTVATEVLEDDHSTVLSVALSGWTMAVSWKVSPGCSSMAGLDSEMPVTETLDGAGGSGVGCS